MDRENTYYIPPQQTSNPNRKRKLIAMAIIGAAALIIIVVVALALWGSSSDNANVDDPGYRLHTTRLSSSDNFSTIQDNEMYSYNGAAFYRLSLDGSNKLTILRSGLKLPIPSSMAWGGSTGAFMSFSGGFLGTKLTDKVGFYADKEELKYAWYVDFASGNITLIDELPAVDGTVYYSKEDNGFYYIGQPVERVSSNKWPLKFFSVASGKTSVVLADSGVTNARNLSKCQKDMKVCYIGGSPAKLYGIDQSDKRLELYTSPSRLFATSNPERYIAVDSDEGSGTKEKDVEENVTFGPAPARLYSLPTKSMSELGFDVSQGEPYLHILDGGTFYSFDSNYNVGNENDARAEIRSGYRAGELDAQNNGKSKIFPLLFQDDKQFYGTINRVAYGKDISLVTIGDRRQLIFTKNADFKLPSKEKPQVIADIKACQTTGNIKSYTELSSNHFRLELADDADFSRNIALFSGCLAGKQGAMVGYNYSFVGIGTNGRITTD